MLLQYTTAIRKLRNLKPRIKVIQGGTSAGKTFGIIPILIDRATKTPNLEISVVSESVPHLRKGALKDFLKIMKSTNRFVESRYNKTHLTYTFHNGSYIEFFSVDDEQKARGARRDILYVNECNAIPYETYYQLSIRTNGDIWLDFNPSHEFWVHDEVLKDPESGYLVLTYRDNEALNDTIVKEIEKAREKAYFDPDLPIPELFAPSNIKNNYWHNKWKVYGLGLLGSLEGVVFSDWEVLDTLPNGAKLLGYGIDFGFTNDPTTVIAAYKWNDSLIFDELLYESGLTNGEIAKYLKQFGIKRTDLIYADSSEPKSIAEINRYGFHVRPAEKGADSINYGIDLLQESKFYITKRSVNTKRELEKYVWAKDKQGKALNTPIDNFNHCIDPMRYIRVSNPILKKSKRKL